MILLIYDWKKSIEKALKVFSLFLTISILSACAQMSSVAAPAGISNNDHDALVKYYEDIGRETKARLLENKKILREYEAHPYYFGRQGLDAKSHASANIREYEKALREIQIHADFHRNMALEQKGKVINKAKANQDRDLTSKSPESSVNKGL